MTFKNYAKNYAIVQVRMHHYEVGNVYLEPDEDLFDIFMYPNKGEQDHIYCYRYLDPKFDGISHEDAFFSVEKSKSESIWAQIRREKVRFVEPLTAFSFQILDGWNNGILSEFISDVGAEDVFEPFLGNLKSDGLKTISTELDGAFTMTNRDLHELSSCAFCTLWGLNCYSHYDSWTGESDWGVEPEYLGVINMEDLAGLIKSKRPDIEVEEAVKALIEA